MPSDWGGGDTKDWGGSEVHDWGVGGAAPPSAVTDEPQPLVVADDGPEAGGPDDVEDQVASHVLLALENLRHSSARPDPDGEEPGFFAFGSGDTTVYAIEDGPGHCMIGRGVGRDSDDCVYCLVGRSTVDLLGQLEDGELLVTAAFDEARELVLCSVYDDDEVSNVVLVQEYDRVEEVPAEYRPASPFLTFTDD
jgi:hypothetical protein